MDEGSSDKPGRVPSPGTPPAGSSENPWSAFVPPHALELFALDDPTARELRSSVVSLFADISGFTAISEALARSGPRGTEELTDLLNDYFGAMLDLIDEAGGSVVSFGGDAVTVVFPYQDEGAATARRAFACVSRMQAAMPRWNDVHTSGGVFELAFKAGLGAGPLLTTVIADADDSRLEPLVAGPALDRCVAAEHLAARGQVVAHPSFANLVDLGDAPRDREGFVHLEPDPGASVAGAPRPPLAARSEHLERAVPVAVAERLRAGHARFVNEHRHVTVLFVGWEPLESESADAAAQFQRFLEPILRTVRRYEGHLVQLDAGDKGSTAPIAFGAPVAHEDEAERAYRCAGDLRELGRSRGLRIGLATGSVFCGLIGGPTRRVYTTIGDTMNLAARLMQHAQGGEILATIPADRTTGIEIDRSELDPISVKGKQYPVAVARIDAVRDARVRIASPAADGVPIGRDDELAAIEAGLRRAATGEGTGLLVLGEPGIGKSRLVAEALARAEDRGMLTHVGACGALSRRRAFFPWRSVLGSLLGLDEDAPAAERRAALEAQLTAIDPRFAGRAPLLGPVLGLRIPDTPDTRGLDPGLRAELLTSFVADLIRALARPERPLLIVIEDAHWIDDPSRDLLAAVARATARDAVLLLVTSRTGTDTEAPLTLLRAVGHVHELQLGPMTDDGIRELAHKTLHRVFESQDDPPTAVLEALAARAEGNPFVVQELILLLRDRGIDPHDARAVGAAALPDTLHALVLARVDTLPAPESATLRVASVVGRRFEPEWLAGTEERLGPTERVRRRLERICALELVEPDPSAGDVFRFVHAVIREATYASLLLRDREQLHERIAAFFEHAYADDIDAYLDVLALHYGASTNVDKQREFFRRAADAARAVFSNDAAVSYLERLVPLTEDVERTTTLVALGAVLELSGQWERAESAFREASEGALDPLAQARARMELGNLLARRASPVEARSLLEEALAVFRHERADDDISQTLEYLAYAALQSSDHDAALRWSQEQLAIAERAGDAAAVSTAVENAGLVHWERGELDTAQELLERALRAAEQAGSPRAVIIACNDLAGLLFERGELQLAFDSVRTGLAAAEDIGYLHMVGALTGNAGELYRSNGELDRALAYAAAGVRTAIDLRDWTDIANKAVNIGVTLTEAGRTDDAGPFLTFAVILARIIESPFVLCEALLRSGQLLADVDRADPEARAVAQEAVEIAERVGRVDVLDEARLLLVVLDDGRVVSPPLPREPAEPTTPLPTLGGAEPETPDLAALRTELIGLTEEARAIHTR